MATYQTIERLERLKCSFEEKICFYDDEAMRLSAQKPSHCFLISRSREFWVYVRALDRVEFILKRVGG